MILVCKRCKASFLVPASLFTAGPRMVRCGCCGHAWPETGYEDKRQPKPPPIPEKQPALSAVQPPVRPIEPKTEEPEEPKVALSQRVKKIQAAVWAVWHSKAFEIGSLSLGSFLVLAFLGLVFAREPIMRTWPDLQPYYARIGFNTLPPPEKLVFQKIHSERRYMDGAMHLVVEGQIASQAEKTQITPPILVEAMGPGGRLIESWHIDPPAAKLAPGATAPFSSAILSPEGSVVEINLSFVEPPHDEP